MQNQTRRAMGAAPHHFGPLLRQWRLTRRMSQLDLALEADVSAKHVSFLETGRSRPSRDMILRLAEVLDVPLRQSNTLLRAAGFAPLYTECAFDDPSLAPIRRSIELLIDRHDPFPAVVCDRVFNVLLQNRGALALMRATLSPETFERLGDTPPNLVRLLFDPGGFRPAVVNWPEVGAATVQRLHREVVLRGQDEEGSALLAELLEAPGVPAEWRFPDLEAELQVVVPLHVRTAEHDLRFFTAITTLGTALDVTLRELVIETFLPADEETRMVLGEMVGERGVSPGSDTVFES